MGHAHRLHRRCLTAPPQRDAPGSPTRRGRGRAQERGAGGGCVGSLAGLGTRTYPRRLFWHALPVEWLQSLSPTSSLTDWIEAIGTGGALLLAVIFGWIEIRGARKDRADRVRTEKRAQASLVNAWLRLREREQYVHNTDVLALAVVENASSSPVYEMVVHIPGGVWSSEPHEWQRGFLVPTRGPEFAEGDPEPVNMAPGDLPLEITFRDAAGVRWRRSGEGILEEMPPLKARA